MIVLVETESRPIGLPMIDETALPEDGGGDLRLECDRLLVELYADEVEKGDDNTVETACEWGDKREGGKKQNKKKC